MLFSKLQELVFYRNPSNIIPDSQKKEFTEEIARINYIRSRNLSTLLLFVLVLLIFLDYDSYQKGNWIAVPGYRLLFYGHVVMALAMLSVLVYSLIARLNREDASPLGKKIFVLSFCFSVSIASVLISIADQFIHGEITVFIICIFALAILNYHKPTIFLAIYSISFLIFIIGITYVQTNQEVLRAHYINGSVLVILAMFLSIILYYGKVRDFLSTKTIERQKMELEKKNNQLSVTNEELNESLSALDESQNMIFTLTLTLESKDSNTRGHSERVAEYVHSLADFLDLPETDKKNIWRAAILHDIGKIGIPDIILNKSSGLTEDEWEIMKSHPVRGESICSKLKFAREILPIIRHHHEHYNGAGYPDGLIGESIPYLARIVSVADTVDAMTSPRNYRLPVTMEEAVEELKRCAGTQFDPAIVEAFVEVYKLKYETIKNESDT